MIKIQRTWLRLKYRLRQVAWLSAFGWVLSIGIIFCIPTLIHEQYPRPLNIENLSDDIGLITQILSVILGISLIGVTVHLSSYGLSDKLNTLLKEIESVSNPLFERFFTGSRRKNKVDNSRFRHYIFRKVGVDPLIFRDSKQDELPDHFVFRPYWDGVWYQVAESPFKHVVDNKAALTSIATLHELVICSAKAIGFVSELRQSGSNLLSREDSSQGSKWFLEELDKFHKSYPTLRKGVLPDVLTSKEAREIVWLAAYSTHYMWEELRNYSEELNWDPYLLSQFQVIFLDYLLWLNYLIIKFQHLRFSVLSERNPNFIKNLSAQTKENLALEELATAKPKLFDTRKKAISELGVSKHYMGLKKSSVPGIGISAIALLAIVVLWPFRTLAGNEENTLYVFSVLYAGGLVGILQGILFMYLILWGKRRSIRRSPMYRGG